MKPRLMTESRLNEKTDKFIRHFIKQLRFVRKMSVVSALVGWNMNILGPYSTQLGVETTQHFFSEQKTAVVCQNMSLSCVTCVHCQNQWRKTTGSERKPASICTAENSRHIIRPMHIIGFAENNSHIHSSYLLCYYEKSQTPASQTINFTQTRRALNSPKTSFPSWNKMFSMATATLNCLIWKRINKRFDYNERKTTGQILGHILTAASQRMTQTQMKEAT